MLKGLFSKETLLRAKEACDHITYHREKFGITQGDSSTIPFQVKMVEYLSLPPTDEFPYGNGGTFYVWTRDGKHYIGARYGKHSADRVTRITKEQVVGLINSGKVAWVEEYA